MLVRRGGVQAKKVDVGRMQRVQGLTARLRRHTGTPILVPLTPSLYVPGKLAATDTVLVDVGTGFYVEKVWRSCVMLSGHATQRDGSAEMRSC